MTVSSSAYDIHCSSPVSLLLKYLIAYAVTPTHHISSMIAATAPMLSSHVMLLILVHPYALYSVSIYVLLQVHFGYR